jgi:MYXO-CTERM domain-containing protein
MSAALRLSLGALSVVSSLSLSAAAIAGPDWDEGPNDAGSTLDTSQTITTDGSLTSIRGKLGGPGLLAGDYQDCFMIRVSDPTVFSVTTAPGAGGPPGFNPMLFLFRVDILDGRMVAKAILANNDKSSGDPQAQLRRDSNDGSGTTITQAGLYLIAVSGFGSQPVNASGQFLFNQAFLQPGVIAGPNGFQQPNDYLLAGWAQDGSFGEYVLGVQGVSGVPAPGALALLALGGLATRRRQR